ncbi:unnamed protein product [Symbiodinium sp. KB8]|nr:unnamed protein product [Symbiodinium sp. KB8]
MKEARSGVSTSTTASLAAESSDAMSARAGDDDGDRERFLREEMPCSLWCCSAHCSKDLVPQVSAVPRVPSRDICLGLADLTNIQPNFNGVWICVEVRGNMDRFLQEMGLDEELRQEAEHSNYGAYQQRQTIVQSGNNFEIANELKARVVSVFSVGGGVQPSRDLHGRPLLLEPSWDEAGGVLLVRSYTSGMELIVQTQRYLERGRMVMEISTPVGTTVEIVGLSCSAWQCCHGRCAMPWARTWCQHPMFRCCKASGRE